MPVVAYKARGFWIGYPIDPSGKVWRKEFHRSYVCDPFRNTSCTGRAICTGPLGKYSYCKRCREKEYARIFKCRAESLDEFKPLQGVSSDIVRRVRRKKALEKRRVEQREANQARAKYEAMEYRGPDLLSLVLAIVALALALLSCALRIFGIQ